MWKEHKKKSKGNKCEPINWGVSENYKTLRMGNLGTRGRIDHSYRSISCILQAEVGKLKLLEQRLGL